MRAFLPSSCSLRTLNIISVVERCGNPVLMFVQNVYHGISPPPRYLPLVPHQLDHPVELSEYGRVTIQSKFEEFEWEYIWSHCLLRVRARLTLSVRPRERE